MPRLAETTIGTGDQSWLGSAHAIWECRTVAPDPDLFTAAAYPDGVPSGTPIGIVTASGLAGPYTGDSTDEVQTVTIDATGGTFTLTFDGQTTDDLDWDATAAEVQAALEALSTIGAGNVAVTGDDGGPYTVTFQGDLANTNVAEMTATDALTGGAGTVTIATATAGGADAGSDGREVLAGFLLTDQKAPGDGGWPLLDHGKIKVDRLPITFAATGHNTTGLFIFLTGGGA